MIDANKKQFYFCSMRELLLIIAFALACGLHAKAQVINSRFLEENNGYLQWNDGERLSFEEASMV